MSALSPITQDAWNIVKARHLLNRAGFGVPDALAEKLAAMPPEEAVHYLVDYEAIPYETPAVDFLAEPFYRNRYRKEAEHLSEDEIRAIFQEKQREEREAVARLKVWWLQRMVDTPRPLQEKLALFWHGHFAVSAQKVKFSETMHEYLQIVRGQAVGNFKDMTITIGQSRAMLDYLDNRNSTKEHPNENWARELMELFTLGKGNYTEADIKESARAFTGWSHNNEAFQYRMDAHDFGNKTFLGRTGNFDGWDIINIIFEQPATAEFISRKLWNFFAYEGPEPEIIAGLAATFRDSGYEIKPLLTQMFLSEAFYGPAARGTQVKSPTQLVVQLTHHLELDSPPWPAMTLSMRGIGQDLLYPPNVKGWDGGRAWINASALLMRYNLPMLMLAAAREESSGAAAMMGGAAMNADPKAMDMSERPFDAMKMDKEVLRGLLEQVREKVEQLPREERRATIERLRNATPEERRQIARELGVQPPMNTGALDALFMQLDFRTAGDCIMQVAARLLTTPLAHEQRDTLLRAMGYTDPEQPLTPDGVTLDNRRALIHLITSMAEYQLC